MNYSVLSILILVLPLLGFVLLSLTSKRINPKLAGIIGTVILAAATLSAIIVAGKFFFWNHTGDAYLKEIAFNFNWLTFNSNLSIDFGAVIDPISVMMLLVITVVSLMVHIFSLSYMHGEERFATYYAYLGLFTFSMLGLVLSVNIFQMYIFWELVGVSSFLLIGFYFTKPSAISAAKKAFIVTRFADLGFLIGILILGFNAQSFDFFVIIDRICAPESIYLLNFSSSFLGLSLLTWALLLVFIGGAGKSAMFPLHIWLPDAMEGPTPVSALIHAATMVVAGVYLVARLFPVFLIEPIALQTIAYIGVFSALFAAVIACTQTDIKRVLAFSTISQIGFMMMSLGVEGWSGGNTGFTASMFHLFTHAFFKALLFLGAGAVIHHVHSNEMNDMGGLRKNLPITHITFLLACIAIAGIPPLSGFFSKEAILSTVFHNNKFIFSLALFTSGLTSFYMFRLYFKIFWNKKSENAHNGEHSFAMSIPLIILALGAVFAGFAPFEHFVTSNGLPIHLPIHLSFSIAPVLFGSTGIALAAWMYLNPSALSNKRTGIIGFAYRCAYNKFYIDEVYLFVTQKIIFSIFGASMAWIDRNVVDGCMNGMASITAKTSNGIKKMQSGNLQSYTMFFLSGVLVLTILLIWKFL